MRFHSLFQHFQHFQQGPLQGVRRLPVGIWLPGVVALVIGLWDLTGPPAWRDEAATASAANRSLLQLADLLDMVDAVHGTYYVFMHAVVRLFGTDIGWLRLPSVAAGVLAAAGLSLLGRWLGNPRAGFYGGLLLAVMPIFSRYIQEARPYGVTMAAAVGVTLLLVRALRKPSYPIFLLYGLAVTGLAYLSLFAVLILGGHGIYVLSIRGPIRQWCVGAAVTIAGVAPLAWVASGQSSQVGWIAPPKPSDVGMLAIRIFGDLGEPGSAWLGIAPLIGALVLFAVAWESRRGAWPGDGWGTGPGQDTGRGEILRLALPWLLVPPLTLLVVSWTAHPFYVFRYVLCSLPAAALLAGAGLAALATLSRGVGVTLLAIIVGMAVPSQLFARGPDGRADNADPLAAVLATAARPGDAVLFLPSRARKFALVYPEVFARLQDVSLRRSPARDGSFDGRDFGPRTLPGRLAGLRTIWVFGLDKPIRGTKWRLDVLRASSFVPTARWTSKGMVVARYQSVAEYRHLIRKTGPLPGPIPAPARARGQARSKGAGVGK